MLSWPAHSPHEKGREVGREEREQLQPSALGGGPPGLSSWQPQPEPEACCGGDLSLLSPVPLPPPAWLYKTVITKSGTQLLPSFHGSVYGPPF